MLKKAATIFAALMSINSAVLAANMFETPDWKLEKNDNGVKIYSNIAYAKVAKDAPHTHTVLLGIYDQAGTIFNVNNTMKFHYAVVKNRYYEDDRNRYTVLSATYYDDNGDIIGAEVGHEDHKIKSSLDNGGSNK